MDVIELVKGRITMVESGLSTRFDPHRSGRCTNSDYFCSYDGGNEQNAVRRKFVFVVWIRLDSTSSLVL